MAVFLCLNKWIFDRQAQQILIEYFSVKEAIIKEGNGKNQEFL